MAPFDFSIANFKDLQDRLQGLLPIVLLLLLPTRSHTIPALTEWPAPAHRLDSDQPLSYGLWEATTRPSKRLSLHDREGLYEEDLAQWATHHAFPQP